MHGHSILTDLAWIMFAAAIAAVVFHKLKIPALLGYLAAGLALGPHLGLWHSPVEIDNVQELAELGVIFLMFYIGLEFDFSRLKAALGPALTAITLQTLLMLFLGMEASRWMGLSTMDGWFLGGILSISSSMVSVKLIRENGLFNKPHANYTIGILVLEDILAILLLVLLSGMATQGSVDPAAVGRSALFIGIFMVAVFLIGKLGTQRLIQLLKAKGSKELVTMATLGLIFAVSLLADRFSFSWALGGFMAGAIFSRSEIAHQIEELTEPLRDLFSAMFFVSVGMLIDPYSLWENAPIILILSALVILFKFSSCWLGLFLGGRSAIESGRASIIKSQIGEFGFVIAAVGAKYGATSSNLQSIASGVAFVTILATPALIKNERRILNFIGKLSPKAAKEFTELYSNWHRSLAVSMSSTGLFKLAAKPVTLIGIHFLLINLNIIGAGLISEKLSVPSFIPLSQQHFQQSVFILSLLISMPFLVDTMRNFNVLVLIVSDSALSRPSFQQFSQGFYRSAFNGLILLLLLIFYGTVFIVVAGPYFPTGLMFGAFIASTSLVGWIFWKKLVRMHSHWETAVVKAMETETENRISQKIATNLDNLKSRRPWDIKVEPIIMADHSKWAGMMVKDIDLRHETGALIAGIERSGFEISNIEPITKLYPQDHIFIIGEPEQITKASNYLNQTVETPNATPQSFSFAREIVPPLCQWNGQRIMDTQMRSQYDVTIVGIQKGEERIIGPFPETIIEEGDLLLLMGIQDKLDLVHELLSCKDESESERSAPLSQPS